MTLAMNMFAQGVDPELDFSDMPHICEVYEACTGMKVDERSPYSGALVFAAFSGSHQDAIAKGMHWRDEKIRIAGRYHICRSIRLMLEEITMQMLFVSTVSRVKVELAISWKQNTV